MYHATYKSNWWGFTGKRVLIAAAVFFIFSLFVFINVNETRQRDTDMSLLSQQIEGLDNILVRDKHVLDTPVSVQFFRFMGGMFTGDWGESLYPESFYSK
jgi:peptide/nickel transport system permease protein